MWQSITAAFLILVASSIGWFANGHLLISLLKRKHQYGRYTFWLTFAKAVTNIVVLLVFVLAEVPNLIAEQYLYPEFVFRVFGAIAGVTAIPNRLFQFFISFGTLFISFFPMRIVPTPIFIISILFPSIIGILVFSFRISSEKCSYMFSSQHFSWFYFDASCAQLVRITIATIVQIQILSCCCFNCITFVKLVLDFRRNTCIENVVIRSRINRTKWRLLQCVAQDILFILDASIYFDEADGYGILVNFIFNTYIWNCGHTVDGLIMWAMLNKIKSSGPGSASVLVISTSAKSKMTFLKVSKTIKTASRL